MSRIIDPRDVIKDDLPLIVFTDDRRGLFGYLIKSHSKGNYNHVMEMHRPAFFASQNPTGYKEIPVESYMKDYINMKFWSYTKATELQKEMWITYIKDDLNSPKRLREYDWLGIIGQALRIPWLNNPLGSSHITDRLIPVIIYDESKISQSSHGHNCR